MISSPPSGGLYQGASIGKIAQVFKDNFVGLRFTYLTIIAVVVVAKIMTYSGMTKEIADALVFATGNAYPIVAPFVGGLGAFITGPVRTPTFSSGRCRHPLHPAWA